MKRYSFSAAIGAFCLLLSLAASSSTNLLAQDSDEGVVRRDLVMFGPAAAGLQAKGFSATGTVKVIPGEEETGTDTMKISISGLPPNTDFTVFLHELSDIPFGSSQYLAEMHTNKKGKASVVINTVIMEAFALKTAGNPPTQRLVDVDLKFVAIWFADPADSAALTPANFPALAFDGDRSSGAVVLGTQVPLH